MKHCVFSTINCEENRREIEIELAKEIVGWLQFDPFEEYKDCKIEVFEDGDKTEVYITSDDLCALIKTCMGYAYQEACRRMDEIGPYRS